MTIGYILYNKKAGNKESLESVKRLEEAAEGEVKYLDVTEITNYCVQTTVQETIIERSTVSVAD